MNIQEFQTAVSAHPEFIEVRVDDYRSQFVAVTKKPEAVLTYDCLAGTYTYAFNGARGIGTSIEAAQEAFDSAYNLVQRQYELSLLG